MDRYFNWKNIAFLQWAVQKVTIKNTESQGYRKTEELEFMVPLYTPENQIQEITVRAYKGDKRLEDHPTISVIGVSGNVLDELRTRLR